MSDEVPEQSDLAVPNSEVEVSRAQGDEPLGEVVQQAAMFEYHRSAPLPDPSDAEHYERITPGAFDRILTMAEKRVEHQSSQMFVSARLADRFMLLGTLVILAGLAAASYMVFLGYEISGTITILVEIALAVFGATYRRRQDQPEDPDSS